MSDAKSPPDLSMDEILTTIRRIIAGDEAAIGAPVGRTTSAAAGAGETVLVLTEAIGEDGDDAAEPLAMVRSGPAAVTEPQPPLRGYPESRREPELPAAIDTPLMADVTALAAALRDSPALRREPRLDSLPALPGRQLEDIIRDLLQPLLQTWLNDNLPLLIERLVQAEIARVVRNPGSI